MSAARTALLSLAIALCPCPAALGADELSGADKLRVVYSNQFTWTTDGLPVVTVRVSEGRDKVVLSALPGAPSLRLLPDGDGGPELSAGATWTVRVEGGRPGQVVWHTIVARVPAADSARVEEQLKLWQSRGEKPRTFELGTVFAVKGKVFDGRQILVTIDADRDHAALRARADALGRKYGLEPQLHPELVERPRGRIEATDERGTVVRNDAILWFNAGAGMVEVRDVERESGGREHRRYVGKVYVTLDSAGHLAVVNAVPEDRLLEGLVPAEMPASAPPEALKAQAVAARNELLAKIGTRHLTDPYRLCSAQHCQVYAGAGREDARTTAAVRATRGELLFAKDGALVDAVYSASCGGHTEDNEVAWGGSADPHLRGHLDGDPALERSLGAFARIGDAEIDKWVALGSDPAGPRPYCARPKNAAASFRWTRALELPAITARLGVGRLRSLTVSGRGSSGRATLLSAAGDGGTKQIRGELEIRRILGNLRSSAFRLAVETDASGHVTSATAMGAGHGHGVGMCQQGAHGMAESGATYQQILEHYYRGSRLQKLY